METAVTHKTLRFERVFNALPERVFSAYSNLDERLLWGAPSDGTALLYDASNFTEGGEDTFRCGPKANPNIQGRTQYLDIVPDRRIVSTEAITMDGRRLCASLTTFELIAEDDRTVLRSTVQLASFVGEGMVQGHEHGTNASLDNLVQYVNDTQR